jgi:anti-anti-sigma regulatory factor
MRTSIETVAADPQLAILVLEGELDASNFQDVIETAVRAHAEGIRRLVIDLADLTYMSSSGLVALHTIALRFAGRDAPDPEAGWDAIHSLGLDVGAGERVVEVKLVGPQAAVARVLDRTGMGRYFEIHPDRDAASQSF